MKRLLGLVVVALLVVALALWGAAQGTWVVTTWSDPLRGTVVESASGGDTEPVLVAWALLALAAVAGVLATGTWGRRVIGALIALAGALAVVRALAGLGAPAGEALPASARGPGTLVAVEVSTVWPLLAAAAALLMSATGAVVAWRAAALPRLGARYDRTAGAAGSGDALADPGRPSDPDKALWDALDAGRDPTADASGDDGTPVRRGDHRGSTMGSAPGPDTADGVQRP